MKIRLTDVKEFAKRHGLEMIRKRLGRKVYYEFYLDDGMGDGTYVGSYWNYYGEVLYWTSDDAHDPAQYNTREELSRA